MTIGAILAVVDGGKGSQSVLKTAFAAGMKFSSYLEALHVERNPDEAVPLIGEGMSGAMVEQIINDMRATIEAHSKKAREFYEQECAAHDIAPRDANGAREAGKFVPAFKKLVGREEEEIAKRALLSDIVVVPRPAEEGEGAYVPALEAALFESGRPVLVAPPTLEKSLGDTVLVSWNGSPEAARAITASLPFLAEAKQVRVVSFHEDANTREADPQKLCNYLALHGISASPQSRTTNKSIGDALLEEISSTDSDMLVMGAYGHSRLREFILGGATRTILEKTSIPVLMAH